MPSCPYCGAYNPEGASFCSLCLARLLTDGIPPVGQPGVPPAHGTLSGAQDAPTRPLPGTHNARTVYVPSGDFRPVGENAPAPPAERTPGAGRFGGATKRSAGQVVTLVLKHSLVVFVVLVICGFILGFFLAGALFSGGRSGFYFTLGLVYAVEALLLIWGGYRISAEALERERGWLYGTVCVAAVIFFWQPLISFLIGLLVTERVVVPQTFSPLGILVALFLFLPLGALGGWLAEKRYMG